MALPLFLPMNVHFVINYKYLPTDCKLIGDCYDDISYIHMHRKSHITLKIWVNMWA